MPHLTLRHSDNLKNVNFVPFFQKARDVLFGIINVKPTSCSGMVTSHQQYLIGDGSSSNIFVHLDILVKPGISEALLSRVSTSLLDELNHFLKMNNMSQPKTSVHVFETRFFSN